MQTADPTPVPHPLTRDELALLLALTPRGRIARRVLYEGKHTVIGVLIEHDGAAITRATGKLLKDGRSIDCPPQIVARAAYIALIKRHARRAKAASRRPARPSLG